MAAMKMSAIKLFQMVEEHHKLTLLEMLQIC